MDSNLIIIGIAALVLVAAFFTFMSSYTLRVTHAILIFGVFVAALVTWIVAANTLHIQAKYRQDVATLTSQIEHLEQVNHALVEGTTDPALRKEFTVDDVQLSTDSFAQIQSDIKKWTLGRGRVWPGITKLSAGDDGSVEIVVEDPDPHKIAMDGILYVFEQGSTSDGAGYLGKFAVTKVNGTQVSLKSTMKLSPEMLNRIRTSSLEWVAFEILPRDRHAATEEMTEEEIRASYPEEVVEEFVRDGKPATSSDPAERQVGLKADGTLAAEGQESQIVERRYQRWLRDYEPLLNSLRVQIVAGETQIASVENDIKILSDALMKKQNAVAYRMQEKENLEKDLARFQSDLKIAKQKQAEISAARDEVYEQRKAIFFKNRELAIEIAKLQLEAARRIENRLKQSSATASN